MPNVQKALTAGSYIRHVGTLDYVSQDRFVESPPDPDWVGTLALTGGLVLLLIGVLLGVRTWQGLQQTNDPNYSWAPHQYVMQIHEALVWLTVIVIGVAMPALLIG